MLLLALPQSEKRIKPLRLPSLFIASRRQRACPTRRSPILANRHQSGSGSDSSLIANAFRFIGILHLA